MNSIYKITGILIFCALIHRSIEDTEINILKQIFNSQSDLETLIPPKNNEKSNESVIVNTSMYIRNIDRLDDRSMELKLQVILRMMWQDPRLNYQYVDGMKKQPVEYIMLRDTSRIWIPDVFISNEKQANDHNIFVPNVYIRIFPNGTVLYSKRISATLSCPMDLRNFPFDSQICSIRLASYGLTTKYISLRWESHDPLRIAKNVRLPYFQLEKNSTRGSEIRTSTGEYGLLSADLHFSRVSSYYFNKFFVPVAVTVLISWIPLWLERVLYLRIYIAFSTVIFVGWHLTVQTSGLMVSYSTGIEVWNAANFIFVFMAALESVFVSYMIKTNKNFIKRTYPDDSDEFKMLPFGPDKRTVYEVTDEKTRVDAEILKIRTNFKICFVNVNKEVQIIDAAAKLFFPSAYVLFLFFYWITY